MADALRAHTRKLHGEAERSGIIADILRGRASRADYALYARNLLPAYEQLEAALDRFKAATLLADLAQPQVYRAQALRRDLETLAGPGWESTLPVLDTAMLYAERIARAGEGNGERLIAHAYTRYLGDLNGGRILGRILAEKPGLQPAARTFFEFAGIEDLAGFTRGYREAFDRAAVVVSDHAALLEEADAAFRCNIEISRAIAASGTPAAAGL